MFFKKTLITAAALILATSLLTACGKVTPLPEDKKSFAGRWIAPDNTWIQIYLDGHGDFKTGNSSVTGGDAEFKGDQLIIGMGPLEQKFTITEAPKQGADGGWVMKLDGNEYKKTDQPAPADTDSSSSTDASSSSTDTSSSSSTDTSSK